MNGLIMAVRRGRIDQERTIRFAQDLSALPIRIEAPSCTGSLGCCVRLATEHRLTIFDAAYLELAQRTGLPLATLDGDFRKAALTASVPLLET